MQITYVGHASIQVVTGSGVRLLTDPWIYTPGAGNMHFLFPLCNIPLDKYKQQDILYISHSHPDHFCPKTLQLFDPKTPIIIRKYDHEAEPLKCELEKLGFKSIIELDHRESCTPLPGLTVTLFADKKSIDSCIMISDGEYTVWNYNDCSLSDEELNWISERFKVNLACISVRGFGPFPASFEMPWKEKERLAKEKFKNYFSKSLKSALILKPAAVFLYASDFAFVRRPEKAKLDMIPPIEFKSFFEEQRLPIPLFLLSSGETYSFKEKPEDYKSYFPSREKLMQAYEIYTNHPKMVKLVRSIEDWESTFVFDNNLFFDHFKKYCDYARKKHDQREKANVGLDLQANNIKVGLRITNGSSNFEYTIDHGATTKNISKALRPLDKETDLHMTLTAPAHIVAMAMQGPLNFYELMNFWFSIKRNDAITSLNKSEAGFWGFFAGFTYYLDENGLLSRREERGKLSELSSISMAEVLSLCK